MTMSNEQKLALLRINLYGAMQLLKGAEAVQFFDLLREVLDAGQFEERDAREAVAFTEIKS
jgi:hypothetical protein